MRLILRTPILVGLFLSLASSTSALEWEQIIRNTMLGWEIKNVSEPVWTITNGVLTCSGERKGEGWFGTKTNYTDFAIEFEFKLPPGGNSGVFLRVPASGLAANHLEIQLLDDYAEKHKSLEPGQYCGSIYKFCPPSKRITNPAGEWNHMRVTAIRHTIQVMLNGVVVVDTEKWQHPELATASPRGAIGFQNYGDRVQFRRIKLADISKDRDMRARWFRDAKFGMFIHWGLYAIPAKGEWDMSSSRIPVAEYEKFAAQFNPVKFNAAEWVSLAKRAGQKYMVITSKHHDGFAMFDTKTSSYNIVAATPFKRDPMRDLAAECARQGVRFGFYHSILDWHHPDFTPGPEWDLPAREGHAPSFPKYMDYMQAQLRELCTGYGPLAVLWYDGGWRGRFQVHPTRMREINDMVCALQPGILINGRCVIPGDFDTPEQTIPTNGIVGLDGLPMPWESCMTLAGNSWGYTKGVTNYKTAKDVVHMLADIVSKGGNLLLNVGPTPEGEIGPRETETLEATGRWLDKYGEAIYSTTASPFRRLAVNGRVTVKGNTIYAIIFEWPKEREIVLRGIKNQIRGARLLDSGVKLSDRRRGDDTIIGLTESAPDSIASVVAIELDGAPVVSP